MRDRGDYDPMDYHDPTAGIAGAPPARSALRLRLALAVFGFVTCSAGAAAFGVFGLVAGTVLLAALAFIALVDIIVVRRRLRRESRVTGKDVR